MRLGLGLGFNAGKAGSAPPSGTAPTVTTPPSQSGSFFVGQTQTRIAGTYAGSPTPTVSWVWQRDGVDISGTANAATYVLQAADDGKAIWPRETASNASGSVSSSGAGVIAIQAGAWFDAADDATVFHTANSVSQWNDKSGNARHISQASGAAQPTYDNATDKITFDGTSDILFNTSAFMYASGAVSAFLVMKSNGTGNGVSLIAEGNSASNNTAYLFVRTQGLASPDDNVYPFFRNDGNTTITSGVVTSTFFDDTKRIVALMDSGTVLSGFSSGVAGSTTITYARSGVFTLDRFAIGGLMRAAAGAYIGAEVSEIIIVPRVMTTDERAQIGASLAAKWSLTW